MTSPATFLQIKRASSTPFKNRSNGGCLATRQPTQPGDQNIPIAGWVISRFVELDLPDPVREGINSANVRPVAWFELNRVPNPSGEKPQYLVAGTRGPDGQPCDFTVPGEGRILLSAELAPGTTETFAVVHRNPHTALEGLGLQRKAWAFLRRRLSEVRDNYISKNPPMRAAAKMLRRRMVH